MCARLCISRLYLPLVYLSMQCYDDSRADELRWICPLDKIARLLYTVLVFRYIVPFSRTDRFSDHFPPLIIIPGALAWVCQDLGLGTGRVGALSMQVQIAEGSNLQTVERAVQLLQQVVFTQQAVGTRESARLLGISPSSAHRLLRTLADLGLLEQNGATGAFGPGLELYRLAATLLASSNLGQAARQPMRRLATKTGEAVFLCVRSVDKRILLDAATGPRQLQYLLRLGEEVPLHVGSSGLAILAWLPDDDLERILAGELQSLSPNTITDPEAMRQVLQTVRAQGYAVSFGHHIEDGVGISAPIFNVHREVLGSLLLTIPEARLTQHPPLAELGQQVREVADVVSLHLGGWSET